MTEIIIPANIKSFTPDKAAEMSSRDPLDESKVSFLGTSVLVPVEVLQDIQKAADKRGVDLSQYMVSAAYRQCLYDLTGEDYD